MHQQYIFPGIPPDRSAVRARRAVGSTLGATCGLSRKARR